MFAFSNLVLYNRQEVMILEKVCLIDPKYNECPYKGEGRECNATDTKCGMLIKLDVQPEQNKEKYVRKPRWYEKYYH